MVVANSGTASLLIINQSNRLVDVMWFGCLFERVAKSLTFLPFPFISQEGSKRFLS